MKELYLIFRGFAVLFFFLPLAVNAQLWTEDFDGSNATNPPTWSEMCSDDKDYFDIVCQNGGGCANEINADFAFNGVSGNYFGIRDMDADPCSSSATKTLGFSGIDVSSCSGVSYICFDVAESRNMGGAAGAEWSSSNVREDTWDSNASVFIKASVDGAAFTNVTALEAFENSDTRPGIDVNCNGKANDAGEPELTDTFTTYCFELPTNGSSLDLEFEISNLNTQGEDLALDNIEVHCGTPSSGTILSACTPFVSSNLGTTMFLEDFDGSNATNPPTWSEMCSDDKDYFDVVCQNGGGCANEISSNFALNGGSGNYFGVRDADSDPCSGTFPKTLSFSGIDVSSCSSVSYLCFDVAESRNIGGVGNPEWGNTNNREDTWDSNASVFVKASVDGAPFTNVTALEAFENSDSRPGIDVNCNGKANDAGEPELTDTFTTYCFELPTNGSSLDLEFEVNNLNSEGEDLALDNIEVVCGTPSGTIIPACTPFISMNTLFFEDFDGSNTTNPFSNTGCDPTPSRDYLGVVCNNGAGCANEINADYIYNNASGQYFGVRDMDNVCGGSLDETITATGIDISSCSGAEKLYLCFDIAESAPNNGREMSGTSEDTWDGNQSNAASNSFVTLSARVDGGMTFPIAGLAAFGNNNSGPGIDTDCDGMGDGAALTDAFQTFCFEIALQGNLLDLDVRVGGMNTDGDDVAIDNITILCTDDIATLPAGLSSSCTAPPTAVIPTMGEWAMIILALMMMIVGVVAIRQQKLALAGVKNANISLKSLPFNKKMFVKTLWMVVVAFLVIFTIAITVFGYELTSADIPGSLISIPLVAYFVTLIK